MSTLKVNDIEDYSGNTVTIKDNTVIQGANSAAKTLTVSGTSALVGNVTCSNAISASSATVSGSATAANVVATTAMTTPALTTGTLTASGNCTVAGTLAVGGSPIVQYFKAFGQYNVSDPTTDVNGSLAPAAGDLNLDNGTYDYDSGNNKATFSVVFSSSMANANYVVIPYVATDYAALFRTRVTNQGTEGFSVEIVYTSGTNPTSSQFFNLHVAVIGL